MNKFFTGENRADFLLENCDITWVFNCHFLSSVRSLSPARYVALLFREGLWLEMRNY